MPQARGLALHALLLAACWTAATAQSSVGGSCVDRELPVSWSGGGMWTCDYYESHGLEGGNALAYCAHAEISSACCFCGGGDDSIATSLAPVTPSSAPSTTLSGGEGGCVDSPLSGAWSGGGAHTCSTYEGYGLQGGNRLANCAHAEISRACCFCGGGDDSAPISTSLSTTPSTVPPTSSSAFPTSSVPTTSSVITTSVSGGGSGCVDSPLSGAWSGGGAHTCSTYEGYGLQGGNRLANCAHAEINRACCFCGGGDGSSASTSSALSTTSSTMPSTSSSTVPSTTEQTMPTTTLATATTAPSAQPTTSAASTSSSPVPSDADPINVCYFTNWARYRPGSINQNKDVFEMGLDVGLCTHFVYGFTKVTPSLDIVSNDPFADHPSGDENQDGLCPVVCNDPDFTPDWSDPSSEKCDWPCSPGRSMRGFEGMNVAMRQRSPGIKTLVSVGGWNFNYCAASPGETWGQGSATCELFSQLAASEEKTRIFAQNVIAFARKWGFDGFDIDWEYPVVAGHNSNSQPFQDVPQDYANYILLLKRLKTAFAEENPSEPLLLTAAVGIGKPTVEKAYDIPEMNKYLDLINLMTYDMHGSWEDRTGCNAPLHATQEDIDFAGYPLSVEWAVDYWIDHGASPDKLTMGVGTYGRGFALAQASESGYMAPAVGASAPTAGTGEAGYIAYYEIAAMIEEGAAVKHYDEARSCPYIVTISGDWVGYDDVRSMKAKAAMAKSKGLRGTMVWALDLDDFDGRYSDGVKYPLIRAIADGWAEGSPAGMASSSKLQEPAKRLHR